MNTDKLQQRQQTLINLITRVGGRQNIQKWMDELLQIDIEQETKAMSKAVTYKKYQLKSNGVYFDGRLLPEDNWCLSAEYGVVLLNDKGADFDPNFELGYDLSHISLTAAEEKQYKNLLLLQRRVEESIKNNEWQYKSTSSTEQDIYGGTTTTVYTRWEHPEFGVFEKTYDSQQLTVPTKYSAEYFKKVCLNVHRAAMLPVLRFQAWVDYWEKIDSQPEVDTYADAKAAAVEKLKSMGVPAELIDIGDKFIFVKGAKASFYKGKEVFHSLDVWYSHWNDVKITPEQVQAAYRFLEKSSR